MRALFHAAVHRGGSDDGGEIGAVDHLIEVDEGHVPVEEVLHLLYEGSALGIG